MKCKNCGKELPSWIYEVLKKEFCSQECENEYYKHNIKNPFEDLFANFQ